MKIPSYLVNFKCIGGRCEDNCCIGWDVDIDKKTYQKYLRVDHPLMKRELKRYVKVNPDVYNESVNYAFAVLDEKKQCSFLNADKLCMIQKHLGESYLSNVCSNFPRITNIIDGEIERSATPSCPEITRLLLMTPNAMQMILVKNPESTPIVTYDLIQKDKRFRNKLLSQLVVIRNRCMSFFEDELESIEDQMLRLSLYIIDLVMLEKRAIALNKPCDFDASAIRNLEANKETNKICKSNSYEFSEMLIVHLQTVGAYDSERYTEFSKLAAMGDVNKGLPIYRAFFNEHPHLFKNLFQNHIYKNLFPFSEGDNPEDALWLFLCRYAILKRQLIGLAGYYGILTFETMSDFIQAFSKVIEHHKHFEMQTIEILKHKKMTTKMLIESIIGSM